MINTYELTPTNGRKSFYGKARVRVEDNGDEVLISYDTEIVRKKPNGQLIAIAEPSVISNTTASHLKSFCGLSKPEYRKLVN